MNPTDLARRQDFGTCSALRLWRIFLAGLALLILVLAGPGQCRAQSLQDVSSDVKITKSGLVYNRTTRTFNTLVSVSNTSGSSLRSLVLAISRISLNSVALVNASSSDSSGNFYLNLPTPPNGLLPREAISNILLQFRNPQNASFTFTLSVEIQTQVVATTDGNSITFQTSLGTPVLVVPLVNQETTSGTITTITHQLPIISTDGTHAGIFDYSSSTDSANLDYEPTVSVGFRYFDSSGLKWQSQAPLGTGYFSPVGRHQNLLASDGSRVLLVSTGAGNSDPLMTVMDQAGNTLFQSANAPLAVSDARLSPNGQHLLAIIVTANNGSYSDVIQITNVDSRQSLDTTFDRVTDGLPTITTSPNGDFVVTLNGKQLPLP